MVKIIRSESEAKKYINDTKKIFEMYSSAKSFDIEKDFTDKKFIKMIEKIKENEKIMCSELKLKILKENLLGNRSLADIAAESMYSVAHIYNLRQKILKEFAMILFEVILI